MTGLLPSIVFTLLQAASLLAQEPAGSKPDPPAPSEATAVDELIVTAPVKQDVQPVYRLSPRSDTREIETEVVRKARMARYRHTGSMKDYPGLRCAVFHRC